MKLLFLAPANSVHSARWIRWFAEHGHEVIWISAHPLEVAAPPGVTLHLLPSGGGTAMRWLRWWRAVRAIARAARPDVVHVHSLGTYALLAFGVPAGLRARWRELLSTSAASAWPFRRRRGGDEA